MTNTTRLGLLTSISCLALWASTAAAQDAPVVPTPPQEEESMSYLEEIVVTARRVSENVQDTPVAVTALTEETLENAQISGTDGLSRLTPSLQIAGTAPNTGNPSAAQIYIRGIGQSDTTPSVDPGVGIYVDDVYLGSAVGGIMDFLDISNVQVLRGPQGTLFGRNTIGGAILLTTREPGAEVGGDFQIGLGSDRLRDMRGAIDLPLSDTLRTRFTFGSRTRDGYVERVSDGLDLGDVNSLTLTGKVLWEPTPDFRIRFKADYTEEESNGTTLVLARVNTSAPYVRKVSFEAGCPGMTSVASNVPSTADPRCFNNNYVLGPYRTASTFPLGSELENWGIQANAEYTLNDALSFKSITAYRELTWNGSRDADNSPFEAVQSVAGSDGHQFSQELQAILTTDGLTMVSGLYYFEIKSDFAFLSILNPLLDPNGAPTPPRGTYSVLNGLYDNSNIAVFTQASLDVTDRLQITAGIRYTEETKDFTPDQYLQGFESRPFVPRTTNTLEAEATTGTVSAQYRFSDAMMAYGSFTRGYKAGGWNRSYTTYVPGATSFRPEFADAYEIGTKLDLSRSLRVNLAAFQTEYDDIQLLYRVGIVPTVVNAGKATIKGIEAEVTFAPTERWLFNGNVSYLDNSIDEVATIPGSTTGVTTANSLPYIPEVQGQVSAQYTQPIGDRFEATMRASVSYVGKQFFEPGNSPVVSQQDGETVIDLNVSLEDVMNDWTARVGVKNLTDEVYPISGNAAFGTPGGYDEISYNRGREWTISVAKSF